MSIPESPRTRADVYAGEIVAQIPRLLAALDREPQSKSYGSFDREHWAWKFRDFPVTMFQMAVYPLALLWRHPMPGSGCHANGRVLEWIAAAMEATWQRQHRNGSFDSVGPYTQDHGVTLALSYILARSASVLGDALPPPAHAAIRDAVARACKFCERSSEDYAFINNHQAFFALAWLEAAELLGEERYHARADAVIEEIVRQQSPDGWYREYGGPDPGYESLGIFNLAGYWQRTRSPRLLESLRRSVEFYAHCVHPDGGVGGVYGSRHTSLYYPGGFEILAGEIPAAASVARFLCPRLALQNVVTPTGTDAENLPSLILAYVHAFLAAREERKVAVPTSLPCEVLQEIRHFAEASITVAGTPHYYAIVNGAKGGVCRIFDRSTSRIAYEDAGYVVGTPAVSWSSQLLGQGRSDPVVGGREVACTAALAEVRQELLTPLKFVVLRLLNLTVFRSVRLGSSLRRIIIGRLITTRRSGPLRLHRLLTFGEDFVRVRDRLSSLRPLRVESVALPRSFMAVHMGSAKYFHYSELEPTPAASVAGMARALSDHGGAERAFVIRFLANSAPVLEVEKDGTTRQSTESEAMARP
ncbi:MAG: hypothetical protein ABR543_11540 [Gemmatimonadaceae bacterium]